jgi:hypothetical protein
MGIQWETPKWRQEGRTGPGPIAPKYKKLSDRNKVRKGKPVGQWKGDSNPGGPGGRTRKIQTGGGGGGNKKKGCCSYVEAGKSLQRRKFRLAARYVRLDVKTRFGLI